MSVSNSNKGKLKAISQNKSTVPLGSGAFLKNEVKWSIECAVSHLAKHKDMDGFKQISLPVHSESWAGGCEPGNPSNYLDNFRVI